MTNLKDIFEDILDDLHCAAAHNVDMAVEAHQKSRIVRDDVAIVCHHRFFLLRRTPIIVLVRHFTQLNRLDKQNGSNLYDLLSEIATARHHVPIFTKRRFFL